MKKKRGSRDELRGKGEIVRITQIATGALSLLFWLGLASAQAAAASPAFNAQAWLLMDHDSGQVLAEHNADKTLAPASPHQAHGRLSRV